jgi:glutamate dehydrogenase/leucine dehydrogenase
MTQARYFNAAAAAGAGSKYLDENGEPRFLEQVKLFLSRAAKKTDIPPDYYKHIESCKSVVRFNIPLRMDNGSIRTIPCYR